jgi:hypothetical protein
MTLRKFPGRKAGCYPEVRGGHHKSKFQRLPVIFDESGSYSWSVVRLLQKQNVNFIFLMKAAASLWSVVRLQQKQNVNFLLAASSWSVVQLQQTQNVNFLFLMKAAASSWSVVRLLRKENVNFIFLMKAA